MAFSFCTLITETVPENFLRRTITSLIPARPVWLETGLKVALIRKGRQPVFFRQAFKGQDPQLDYGRQGYGRNGETYYPKAVIRTAARWGIPFKSANRRREVGKSR